MIIIASIFLLMFLLVGLIILFVTEEGINFVHSKTNIICNYYYDENSGGWLFSANSTEISDFINECKLRGVGNSTCKDVEVIEYFQVEARSSVNVYEGGLLTCKEYVLEYPTFDIEGDKYDVVVNNLDKPLSCKYKRILEGQNCT